MLLGVIYEEEKKSKRIVDLMLSKNPTFSNLHRIRTEEKEWWATDMCESVRASIATLLSLKGVPKDITRWTIKIDIVSDLQELQQMDQEDDGVLQRKSIAWRVAEDDQKFDILEMAWMNRDTDGWGEDQLILHNKKCKLLVELNIASNHPVN